MRSGHHRPRGDEPTDIYVATNGIDDKNRDGSINEPFQTIQFAQTQRHSGAAGVLHVMPGVYRVQNLVTDSSGGPDGRFRIISEERWQAKIIGTTGGAVWQHIGNFTDIEGFEVSAACDSLATYGIQISGASNAVKSNHVHHILGGARRSDGGFLSCGGIGCDMQYDFNDVIGNYIHDIGFFVPTVSAEGIYLSRGLKSFIHNNIIHRVRGFGFWLYHRPQAMAICNNLVFNCEIGISIGAKEENLKPDPEHPDPDYPDGYPPAEGIVVANNIFLFNKYVGLAEQTAVARDGMVLVGRNSYLYNYLRGNGPQQIVLHTDGSTENLPHLGGNIEDPGEDIRVPDLFVRYDYDGYDPVYYKDHPEANSPGEGVDLHPAVGSPLVGAGTIMYPPAPSPTDDFDGNPRNLDSWPMDIGPYVVASHTAGVKGV